MVKASELGAECRVGRHDGEATETEGKENKIGHEAPPGSNWSAICVSGASNLDMEHHV